MRYITPSILFAVVTLSLVLCFFLRYLNVQTNAPGARPRPSKKVSPVPRLSFAGTRYPIERKDRLPVVLITLVYAFTAFFQLGDAHAPQDFYDFGQNGSVSIEISGDPVRAAGIRYYTGLGVGSYNVEVSSDGEHWSTLWKNTDDDSYYWADAEGYEPSYALSQPYSQLFKWDDVTVTNPIDVKYLRITGKADGKYLQVRDGQGNDRSETRYLLELGRLCLLNGNGQPLSFQWTVTDSTTSSEALSTLFSTEGVPEKSTWHNSTYFDEIYHARTAKEHIDNVYPYEVTHPPLGKLILGIGIRLFGMTPFGWRFSGTLFGVLMLPILYVFLKNMFGKTPVASCGTILFAAEFMHLTQTRIATIDTYAVFFILGMYFFMYRYLTLPAGTSFRKGALPLFLSGLMWALGISSKWTVIYGGLGLAVVYFMGFYQKLRDWRPEAPRAAWVSKTLLFSVFCFILMPLCVYTASYLPYAKALGVDTSLGNTLSGVGRSIPVLLENLGHYFSGHKELATAIPNDSLTGLMAENQWYMLTYHQGVGDYHPYSSRWFQWLVDARPILYYMDNTVAGHTTRFAAFSNPAVCWAGLGAILVCACHSLRRLWSKAVFLAGLGLAAVVLTYRAEQGENCAFYAGLSQSELTRNWVILIACLLLYLALCAFLLLHAPEYNSRAAFIFVAYLSQLAPWWLIGRTTFAYHYFPSLLFLVFAISYLFNGLMETDRKWQVPIYGLTGLAATLYLLFYPVLIGLSIPTWYEPVVKWIESWPF